MLILFWTVLGGFVTVSQAFYTVSACYGQSVDLPAYPFLRRLTEITVYFSPSSGGPRRTVWFNGRPNDTRIKNNTPYSYRLTKLNAADDGEFFTVNRGGNITVLKLEVSDCTKKFSMDDLEYDVPVEAQFLEFTPDSLVKPIILWSRTDPQSHDERRGNVRNNVWRISKLTQADNGYYSFKEKNDTLISRVHLTVEGKERGRDSQGNVALTTTLKRDSYEHPKPNHAVLTYVVVAVVIVFVGIFCCCCCVKCCKEKSSSAPQSDAGPAETFHDKTSETATGPAVYYHDTPTGPGYPVPTYSVFPQEPQYQPVNTNPPQVTVNPLHPGININPTQVNVNPPLPGINVNPFHPGINVNPPQVNVNPPQPGINLNPLQPGINLNPPQVNVNPPQPGINLNPFHPGINLNPLQPEASPPTDQGSEAVPTFSLGFLPSDNQPRFELKGLSFPSAPPLGSDTPSCDVYNSDKLNFL